MAPTPPELDVMAHLARVQSVLSSAHQRIAESQSLKAEAWARSQVTRDALHASYDRLKALQDRPAALSPTG